MDYDVERERAHTPSSLLAATWRTMRRDSRCGNECYLPTQLTVKALSHLVEKRRDREEFSGASCLSWFLDGRRGEGPCPPIFGTLAP
jgi:hypothetical protein